MRKEQKFVGRLEGRETAAEVVSITVRAMKFCVRGENRPAQCSVTAQMSGGTVTKQSVFFCDGTEREFSEMIAVGSNAALWYDEDERLGKTDRKCELSILLETVEPPVAAVFMPECPVYA